MRVLPFLAALVMIGAPASAGATRHSVTLFAVGDIADCRAKNPSLISADALDSEERAEHQVADGAWLPQEPLQIEELIEDQPGIVLGLGDLAYPAGTLEQYKDCFEKVWGPAVSRTYPVLGNHEEKTGGEGYRQFWGPVAGGPGNYYSLNYGSWHLVALNSEMEAGPGSPQAAFLEQDLATAGTQCILAFFHRPAFASLKRSHGEHAREIFRILDRHKVTLVLNGHNHYYERTTMLDGGGNIAANGIREFVVGTGGKHEDYGPIASASFTEKLIAGEAGVLRMELREGDFSWQFISAKSNAVLDTGDGTCRSSKASQ